VTIYDIATKFGIRMHPYPAFQFTKFQGNQNNAFVFYDNFHILRKKIINREEEKNEETQPIF